MGMRLMRLLGYILVLPLPLSFPWEDSYAGSRDLAKAAKSVIASTDPEDWPIRCLNYREEGFDANPELALQRIEPAKIDSESSQFAVATWNGIQIPIPDAKFDTVAMVPGSIAMLRSESTNIVFTRLDLAPHFKHFGEIEEFSNYVENRNSVVEWLDAGLELRVKDIQCRPESMIDDLVGIVHSLIVGIAVLVNEETILMRIHGKNPALLLGNSSRGELDTRIQYIFQGPSSNGIEMFTVSYHIDEPMELILRMNALASVIDGGKELPRSEISDIVRPILDQDYEEASSIAKARGLTVKMGLP